MGAEFVLCVLPSAIFLLFFVLCRPSSPFVQSGMPVLTMPYVACVFGVQVYWSGFSSATPDRTIAMGFAGPGGVLLRIRVQPRASKARNVRLLSAITIEQEVILPALYSLTQLIMTLLL